MPENEFSTAPRYVRAGFDRVMAGTDVDMNWREEFYETWLPAHRSGDPRKEHAAISLILGYTGWRWTALDGAADLFSERPDWPLAWRGQIDRPYDWATVHPRTKAELLRGSLSHAAYTARDVGTFVEMVRDDPGARELFNLTLETSFKECAIEMSIVELYRPPIERGDYTHLPPFFPGCGVAIRTKKLWQR